jgi:hypothetical protein
MPIVARRVFDYFRDQLKQAGIWLFPLLLVIRAPRSIGALWAMTSTPPVPLTGVTEEYTHAQASLKLQFEFV